MSAVITDQCTSCGLCEGVCPTGSISPGARVFVIDHDTCVESGTCAPVCPVGAIRWEKKPKK